jgi:hypothetical protein
MKLDSETAERLSLDAALGQLAPDVRALWEAYLSERPELAGPAGLDRRTVALARQALGEAESPRAFIPLAAMKAPRRLKARSALRWSVAVAAGLVAGLTLGLFVAAGPGPRPARKVARQQPSPAAPTPAALVQAAPTHQANQGFWSVDRLYRQAANTGANSADRVTWTSPVKPPIMGDRL